MSVKLSSYVWDGCAAARMQISMMLDLQNPGSYSNSAAAKSVAGLRTPEFNRAHDRACGFFMRNAQLRLSSTMVGWAGASQDAPGSLLTGSSNPVQFTTLQSFEPLGGGNKTINREAAIMATTPAQIKPEIRIISGRAMTTSVEIAWCLDKDHDHVVKKITQLECSPEFFALHFTPFEHTDFKDERRPAYHVSRDGFAFLAMSSFTGKRATIIKEVYLNAFNKIETHRPERIPAWNKNAEVVVEYLAFIVAAWERNIRPMLVAAKSPLAVTLHDQIHDAHFVAKVVCKRMRGGL